MSKIPQFLTLFSRLEATLHADKNLGPNDITFLTPDRGNIHTFTAHDNTIFLDISIPINDAPSYCNYYQEIQTTCPIEHNEAQKDSDIEGSQENIHFFLICP
ncbi:MAG: hypothetical protein EOO43_22555 [Flavobacterium sp.]|nr:MAG: hypothetical protein EOO43_22555 [Flavobacterium sp.]